MIFKFEWEEVSWICLSLDGDNLWNFVNLSCIELVYPDHLILRYCSCNTYLLHRRAELKAAPGTSWLMRKRTLGN